MRASGRKPSRRKWIKGTISFSPKVPVSWRGKPLARPMSPGAHERRDAGERVGREAHVRVDEDQEVVAGALGQHLAGVLLARPAGRQRRRQLQPNARIGGGERRDHGARAITRVVVEHHHLEVDPAALERGSQRGADLRLLVAGGDQEREPRPCSLPGARRRPVEGEIPGGQQRREQREPEGEQSQGLEHHRPGSPWPAWKRRPARRARR